MGWPIWSCKSWNQNLDCIFIYYIFCCCSVAQLCLTLRPHGLQHARLPCPSPTPGGCSSSCPSSQWCHPAISYSAAPLLFLPSIFPSIRVFSNELALPIKWPKHWSFSFSINLSMNIQDWFPLGLNGWNSLQSKGLSRVFSSTTIQKHQFLGTQSSLWPNSYIHTWLLEKQ